MTIVKYFVYSGESKMLDTKIQIENAIAERMRNRVPEEQKVVLVQLLQDVITGTFKANDDAIDIIQSKLSELDTQIFYNKVHAHVNHPLVQIVNITGDNQFVPKKSNNTDACFDLRAYINKLDSDYIVLEPGQIKLVSTGIKVHLPEGYVMKMYVRSSTGYKKHLMLANGTGIIDAGYRDEVFMCLYNFGTESIEIKYGDRLCQFEIQKVLDTEIAEVQDDKTFDEGNRGGGFGSTNK